MSQSRRDLAGYSHTHGWGIATYEDHHPLIERQAWAAYHGEHFTRAVARAYSKTVIAHVRRATVGGSSIENTHPFTHNEWTFAHNGTVPHFDEIREQLLSEMTLEHRNAIVGETDSEHLFRYALTLIERNEHESLIDVLRRVLLDITRWVFMIDPQSRPGLNMVLTAGDEVVGSRWGRTLHVVSRIGVYDCEICGFPHIHHEPNRDHRAVVIASEPITHEDWREISDKSLWHIDKQAQLTIQAV